jgi:hypothetical protein
MILTIVAIKIAACKKNVTDAMCSAYDRFLTPVDTDGSNIQTRIRAAISISPFKPVDTAFPRA